MPTYYMQSRLGECLPGFLVSTVGGWPQPERKKRGEEDGHWVDDQSCLTPLFNQATPPCLFRSVPPIMGMIS